MYTQILFLSTHRSAQTLETVRPEYTFGLSLRPFEVTHGRGCVPGGAAQAGHRDVRGQAVLRGCGGRTVGAAGTGAAPARTGGGRRGPEGATPESKAAEAEALVRELMPNARWRQLLGKVRERLAVGDDGFPAYLLRQATAEVQGLYLDGLRDIVRTKDVPES